MRKGIWFFVVFVALMALSFNLNAYAQSQGEGQKTEVGFVTPGLEEKAEVDQEWEKQADSNKDGIVDNNEIKQWKERRGNMPPAQDTAGVDTDKSEVNTGWERKADANQDGVVDQTEIEQWRNRPGDNDNNPPGEAGASADVNKMDASQVNRPWEKAADDNKDGRVDRKESNQWNREGNNPPGKAGGPGSSASHKAKQGGRGGR